MEYDYYGLPLAKHGKRRPKMPKTVICQRCDKPANKIDYGTYGCKDCGLCYQFKFGKLVRGYYKLYIKRYTDKDGCQREKASWVYSFMYDGDGQLLEPKFYKHWL